MADLEKLGKYEIRRELGRGAMGVVYEGYDEMIKRIVALKTIRADQLQGDDPEAAIARFRREAQAAGRLSHPNIVGIYDFGEENGTWYIAMEYVNGRELKDYFQANERFATSDIVRIMTQILSALDYSHRQGVVHRDIKPANVIILPDGSVKVADFGIAHIETSNMTQLGAALGTPAYMSPEQIQGLPVDGRSDLFSAGVILYQFLTGERPFVGTTTVTMRKVLEENPLPPSRFNVQLPPEMDTVVQMALAKRPEDRFQNAKAFITALHNAAQSIAPSEATAAAMNVPSAPSSALEPTVVATARPLGTATRTAAPPASPPPPTGRGPAAGAMPPAAGSPAYSSGNKQTSAVIVVVAVVVVALAAGGWFGYNWFAHRDGGEVAKSGGASTSTIAKADSGAQAPTTMPAPAPASKNPPGKLTISAVGWVDPSDARYQADKSL
ncbi:MAG TPA: serine/threonine-protein kinase, partial [Casimicrobiaceae bacterium]|nr:serine/threonine-protein kinase [Casimicrobiaceae bacterium]